MATKRLTNYEKAYNRLMKVTVEGMVADQRDAEKNAKRLGAAVERILAAHWENHPDECEWCAIYPPLL